MEINNIEQVPEEIRWDLTFALIMKFGQELYEAAEWAVQNSRKTEEFDLAFSIRSNVEALAEICNEFVKETLISQGHDPEEFEL